MKKMIFHAPYPLDEQARSASGIRPVQLRNAFRELGYEVAEVVGTSGPRSAAIADVKRRIGSGERFDFCYSESSTMPMSMTDPRHLPLHPLMDYAFFRQLRSSGTPVGHFLRDIYWLFPEYRENVAFPKREVALAGYRWDLHNLRRCVDVLYLPSMEMADYLPAMAPTSVRALPPGHGWSEPLEGPTSGVRLFYVGGTGYNYRLHRLVEAVTTAHEAGADVALTICTPPDQWNDQAPGYLPYLSNAISIVSGHGDELIPYYRAANVGALAVEPYDYWRFAVPVKMFDYLGAGKPVLASNGTLTADLVKREGIGWGVDYTVEALTAWLTAAASDPSVIARGRDGLEKAWSRNTWLSRAQSVASELTPR